jgi:hypothetical protein
MNKVSQIGAVILLANEAKNTGVVQLRRVFSTKLAGKRTSIMAQIIFDSSLRVNG